MRTRDFQCLLERAAAFRLLARALSYPDGSASSTLGGEFKGLKLESMADKNPLLMRALKRAARAWLASEGEASRAEYARLFLGSGPCSLHETAYGDGRRIAGRAVELADISGFYLAFGFGSSRSDPDLPDHVCSELEYYSLMLLKLAYAHTGGWSARTSVTLRALKDFLEDHLGRWAGALAAELRRHGAASPYRETGELLERMIGA